MQRTPADQQPLVSVIVLTYGSAKYIAPCLRSLASSTYPSFEVVVADNASTDGSIDLAQLTAAELQMPIKLVPLTTNLGCAGGNNAGWRSSTGDILVFLNPDTEVQPDFLTELVAPLLTDVSIGITGAKMYYPNSRTLQHAGGILHPNGMTDHFGIGREDAGQHDEQRDVDYVTGAGFAIRRSLMEELGGFDEEYFPAYYEELDLCIRGRKTGKRVVYVPTAVMTHHESVSLGSDSPALRKLYAKMRIQFCLKNFSMWQLLRYSIPFEIKWMLREPLARGQRLNQFSAYAANWRFLLRKLTGGNRRRIATK